jgi:hypothetical protein
MSNNSPSTEKRTVIVSKEGEGWRVKFYVDGKYIDEDTYLTLASKEYAVQSFCN